MNKILYISQNKNKNKNLAKYIKENSIFTLHYSYKVYIVVIRTIRVLFHVANINHTVYNFCL